MENFERASRVKLRFEGSGQGQLAAEDLFDLSLTALDNIAQKVNKQLQDEGAVSFLPSTISKRPTGSVHNSLRLDILKHVIASKVEESEAKKARADKAAMLNQLKELATAKTTEKLASQSLEDIMKQISELEAAM